MEPDLYEIAPFLFLYLAFIGLLGIFGLVGYFLKGFGMYGMAKNLNIKNGWLAFIPVVSLYLQGELAGKINIGRKTIHRPGLWNLLIPIISGIFMLSFFIIIAVIRRHLFYLFDRFSPYLNEEMGTLFGFFCLFMLLLILFAVVFQVLFYVYIGLVRFKTYQRYTDDAFATIHMLLGLVIPLYYQIYYFILRNKKPKEQMQLSPLLIAEEDSQEESNKIPRDEE